MSKFVPCGKCNNGFIYTKSGGAVVCSCLQAYENEAAWLRILRDSNIPTNYWNCTHKNYHILTDPNNPEVERVNRAMYDVVSKYIVNMKSHLDVGNGMVFIGPNNCGKTHLAAASLIQAMYLRRTAYFMRATEYIAQCTRTWSSKDVDELNELDRIREVDILCIDDIDKVAFATGEFKGELIDDLLRDRITNELSTVVTANLDLGNIAMRLPPSTYSLLCRKCRILEFRGSYTSALQNKLIEDWSC